MSTDMPAKVKWNTIFASILVLAVQLATGIEQRQCNHLHPRPDEVIHGVQIESPHTMRKRSVEYQPLRIRLYYDESVNNLAEEKSRLLKNTIWPEAVRFWEQALMVRKTENVIRLNRKCVNNEHYYKNGDHHPYCRKACEKQTMCGEVQVPEDHLEACKTCNASGMDCGTYTPKSGVGIEGADFVFYVSALNTERCHKGLTVAYAANCQQESALDRPIAGHANLCPESISTKPQELEVLLSTVKHEILHALGFSVSLFAFYRDANGLPLTAREHDGKPRLNEKLQARQWSGKVIKTVIRRGWVVHGGVVDKKVQMMVTPRVVDEVRKHFNCSYLEGAELEDQGEDGTALSHWEKRIFGNEAMTGMHTQNPVFSRLTLALMEDTGWYKANYSLAQDLSWGRNLGCDFVKKSCKQWMDMKRAKGQSIHPFCNKVQREPMETECADDRSSVVLCNLIEHVQPLPKLYQNFDEIPGVTPGREEYYGGPISLADYCPYMEEIMWRKTMNESVKDQHEAKVRTRGSHCQYPENNPHPDTNFALEVYGNNSKCFYHTNRTWTRQRLDKQTDYRVTEYFNLNTPGCYEYTCRNGRLHIIVSNHTYTCYIPGQELDIRLVANGWLHEGVIVCPTCEDLCGNDGSFGGSGDKCIPPSDVPPIVPSEKTHWTVATNATTEKTNKANKTKATTAATMKTKKTNATTEKTNKKATAETITVAPAVTTITVAVVLLLILT